jgi:hypothetical protein
MPRHSPRQLSSRARSAVRRLRPAASPHPATSAARPRRCGDRIRWRLLRCMSLSLALGRRSSRQPTPPGLAPARKSIFSMSGNPHHRQELAIFREPTVGNEIFEEQRVYLRFGERGINRVLLGFGLYPGWHPVVPSRGHFQALHRSCSKTYEPPRKRRRATMLQFLTSWQVLLGMAMVLMALALLIEPAIPSAQTVSLPKLPTDLLGFATFQ